MSKSIKPVPGVPKPLTKEEQAQRMAAYLAQKKEQLFHGCLFSLLSNSDITERYGNVEIVNLADEFAERGIAKMYNLEPKEGE